jgi:hypothetical protein
MEQCRVNWSAVIQSGNNQLFHRIFTGKGNNIIGYWEIAPRRHITDP